MTAGIPGTGAMSSAHAPMQPVEPQSELMPDTATTLFASSATSNTVTQYSVPSNTVLSTLGPASGITNPEGLFVYKSSVYVTSGNQVLVFPIGQSTPSLTLQEGQQFQADDVAVAKNGTVYVANYTIGYSEPGDVLVFKKGQKTAEYGLNFSGLDPVISDTLDSSGNLYVAYLTSGNAARINEYPPGSQKGTNTGFSIKHPGGMAFDKDGNLVVVDETTIDVFTPGTSKPTRTFGSLQNGQFLTFNKQKTNLYVSDLGTNQIDEFDYATGKVKTTITLDGVTGLAYSPPAAL